MPLHRFEKESMKVLLINNFHFRKGGSEAVYFNTAELLRSHGHEVVFFSYKDDRNVECEQSDLFVDHKGSIGTIKDYFYNTEAERKLEALIEREHPDIAHVHLFWGGLSASIFKALKKHHIPLVHTVHDYRLICPGYTFKDGNGKICERCHHWNYYECAVHRCSKGSFAQSLLMAMEMYERQICFNPLKNIDGFIFVSNFSENKHLEHNDGFGKVYKTVIYNYTTPCLNPAKEEKKDYFLYYGRLSFEKGLPTLLQVFARHPEWKLKVVGTGPLEESLRKECYENIQFLGYHSEGTLFELVRNAKFVCVPSECYENNPMTIVESYSLGSPVIGSRIGGIPEIIDEGNTGWLFENGDMNSLEAVLKKASDMDCDDYSRMYDNAYSFYKNNFSADAHYKKLIEFYNLIINNK